VNSENASVFSCLPEVGSYVRDVKRNKVGRLMERGEARVYLRPPDGGREWEARIDEVEPISEAEVPCQRATESDDARHSVHGRDNEPGEA